MLQGTGCYSLAAPVISVINNDIGPNASYVWVGLVNVLMQAIGFTLVGRLSDLAGRRYFVIAGNALGVTGSIVSATAKSIPVLIGGNVLLGLAACVQTSVPFILGELVPMKYRFLTTGLMYWWGVPATVFGPAVSYALISHTTAGWRWIYYLLIISNTVATVCWVIFYHPPTFIMITRKSRTQMLKDVDWAGFVTFTGGLLLFLMGLSWGGTVYDWRSAHVLSTLVVGAVMLIAFALWECFMTLKEPIIPLTLFKQKGPSTTKPYPLSWTRTNTRGCI